MSRNSCPGQASAVTGRSSLEAWEQTRRGDSGQPMRCRTAQRDRPVQAKAQETMDLRLLIQSPRNGEFGAVVVGANLQEKFPRCPASGHRVAYTFTCRWIDENWILQYSLPRQARLCRREYRRLEAPCHLTSCGQHCADAFNSMLFSFTLRDQAGRLNLCLLHSARVPAGSCPRALNQWQFRPASATADRKGRSVLIIPESRTGLEQAH